METAMNKARKSAPLLLALAGTVAALVPQCLMRGSQAAYMFFYDKLTTYPGDLWNFFANYLAHGLRYPPEYPAGLRFVYEAAGLYRIHSYEAFFALNAAVIGAFAVATTWLLYLILRERARREGGRIEASRLWLFWILAPSFLFYAVYNYDIPVVFLAVLGVFFALKGRPYGAVTALAAGTVVKVFPIFILPALIWMSPRHRRLPLAALFIAIVVALNLPYALTDFHSWIYPYVWQISSNLTTSPAQGTYWWILYPLTGKLTGWVSLGALGALYLAALWGMSGRRWPAEGGSDRAFLGAALIGISLFLLTDRIYSPQYDLYLLPFLVLSPFVVDKRLFYAVEIPNLLLVLLLFYLREHYVALQMLSFIRYAALAGLSVKMYRDTKGNLCQREYGSSGPALEGTRSRL
ncbi:MAG: DUF2029 domain-containing protein [Patescibacteria group bacterium]|nr:DUF2029 domain-containing protein [Patescibacteria group bacterium]